VADMAEFILETQDLFFDNISAEDVALFF